MRTLVALALFIGFQFHSHAQEITAFGKGDVNFSMAHSNLVSVQQICPQIPGRINCQAFGSMAKIMVTMNGCLDKFGGYFSRFEVINGKGYLFFSAINIYNQESDDIRCLRAPTKLVSVSIPYEGEIELVPLEFKGTGEF